MCMSSTGTNNSVSKFEPPGWTTDTPHNWQDYVSRGGEIADQYATNPHLVYGNDGQPMVAQMSDLQNRASNGYYGLASGVPMQQQQQTQINANDLLNGFMYNGGVNTQGGLGANPYGGDNPYLQSVLDKSNTDITNNYLRGTAAQTASAAARAGAMGGSNYDDLLQANNKTLGDSLAQNESNVRMGNYNNSASLAENALNRGWQGQESAFGRGMQALQMNNSNLGTLNQLWGGVMGSGDLQQQTQQNNINAAMNLFNANVQQPISAEDLYGSILQRASGQGGTNTVSTPGQNPLMGLLGGGMAAYGLRH